MGIFILSNKSVRAHMGTTALPTSEISGQTSVYMVLPPTEIQFAFRDIKQSSREKEELSLSDLVEIPTGGVSTSSSGATASYGNRSYNGPQRGMLTLIFYIEYQYFY